MNLPHSAEHTLGNAGVLDRLVYVCAQSPSRVWLFATPRTLARQAPLSMGIFQARILEWIAMPSSRGSSQPRDWTQVSYTASRFFTVWATREALSMYKDIKESASKKGEISIHENFNTGEHIQKKLPGARINCTASQVAQWQRSHLPMQTMQETMVRSLGPEDPLEKEMATCSSILAWRVAWTEEPGGLQSMGLQRVGHDWAHRHKLYKPFWYFLALSTMYCLPTAAVMY